MAFKANYWIGSRFFLTNRQQRTVINNAKSDVVSGVATAGICNSWSIPNIIYSPSLLFADDTNIFCRISSYIPWLHSTIARYLGSWKLVEALAIEF